MSPRTSVLLLALAFCVGAAVLALRPASITANVEPGSGRIVETPQSNSITPTLADTGTSTTSVSRSNSSFDASHSIAVVAGDADGDETSSPLDGSCWIEDGTLSASAATRIAGAISGLFVREGSPWTESEIPAENTVIVDLASIEQPTRPARRALSNRIQSADGTIAWTFTFDDVLEGEYLLTLSALGARRWSPTSLRVRAPLDGVVLTRFDKDRAETLAFEVVDAETNAPLAPFDARHIQVTGSNDNGVFLHTGPLALDSFPLDARFQWSLRAEGYAIAFGDETAFQRRGEQRIASVRLAHGWASKVFVLTRDPTGRPAAGAEVLLDGVRAGFTASDGMLVVAAAAEPAQIDVKLAGFRLQEGAESHGNYTARQRGGVTVVMLDRE
ncbi:MAG: hypothetical protein SGI72_08695 [Planctomycetota bacterium]|nr:hypothetical protein [Planctomycetota bacterium]